MKKNFLHFPLNSPHNVKVYFNIPNRSNNILKIKTKVS